MTTPAALARLETLVGEAGHNYFERITLVAELLDDREWIRAAHKGDAYVATEFIEEQFLHDICGMMSVWEMLHIKQKFPNEADWKSKRYNLRKLHDACKQSATPETKQTRKVVKISEFNEVKTTLAETQYKLKETNKQTKSLAEENIGLRTRVRDLERENNLLTSRVQELERILSNKFAKV